MVVLITGGAGYIGSKLAKKFLDSGYNVRIFEYNGNAIKTLRELFNKLGYRNVDYVVGDVLNKDDIKNACRDVEYVYHMAGIANMNACMRNPLRALQLNGYAVRIILEECRNIESFQKFFYPSSVAGMYTKPKRDVITADDPVYPVNDYGVSKFLGETYCKAYYDMYGLPTVIFRQSNIYGPSPIMKFDNVVHLFVKKAMEGEAITIHGNGLQARDFLYIDDLVDAYFLALQTKKTDGETYNICSGRSITIKEVAERIKIYVKEFAGIDVDIKFLPMPEGEAEIRKFLLSSHKAEVDFGFKARYDFKTGLKILIKEVMNNNDKNI